MKRGTVNHPKMSDLSRVLGVEQWGAVGIMNSLWDWASSFVPNGGIGKYSNATIAEAIGWTGNADKLIEGLLKAEWLDNLETCRLFIHDWPIHCEDSVHARLARERAYFADGSEPRLGKLGTGQYKDEIAAFYEEKRNKKPSQGGSKRQQKAAKGSRKQPTGAESGLPVLSVTCPLPVPTPRPQTDAPSDSEEAPVVGLQQLSAAVGGGAHSNVFRMPIGTAGVQVVQGTIAVNGDACVPSRGRRSALSAPDLPPISDAVRDVWVKSHWEMHPKKQDMFGSMHALDWFYATFPDRIEQFERHHSAWCKEQDWLKEGARWCPTLVKYISDEKYKGPMPDGYTAPGSRRRTVSIRPEDIS